MTVENPFKKTPDQISTQLQTDEFHRLLVTYINQVRESYGIYELDKLLATTLKTRYRKG